MAYRAEPLQIHKSLVIKILRDHPEDLRQIFPDNFHSAAEAIAHLEQAEGDWFINGSLTTLDAYEKEVFAAEDAMTGDGSIPAVRHSA